MKLLWVLCFVCFFNLSRWGVVGHECSYHEIERAVAKGAVCLDGSPAAYQLQRGWDSGANSWLLYLSGGGWCEDIKECSVRKTEARGSTKYDNRTLIRFAPFGGVQSDLGGIQSDIEAENKDFFNWNKVSIRYCDGASFTGDSQNEASGLYFRGQRIWLALMEDLMKQGLRNADQILLAGGSAGGLAAMVHCDEFAEQFPKTTTVKCLSDAGLFLDAKNLVGEHKWRKYFHNVFSLQESQKHLPQNCIDKKDPLQCFFPEYLIDNIKTPLFLLNSAYDKIQLGHILDYKTMWKSCTWHRVCNGTQIERLKEFRDLMIKATKKFSESKKNGLFINSCFTHGQSFKRHWSGPKAPRIENKGIMESVGNWFFNRERVILIDNPYPSNKSICIHDD